MQIKKVFYLKKVRPRDLTENFGTGSAYPINNYNEFVEVWLKVQNLKLFFFNNYFFFDNVCDSSLDIKASIWARTFWSSSVFVRDASATSLNFSNCSLVLSMINKLEINHF